MIVLRPYQKKGPPFLLGCRKGLLGDDPGLGKTYQAFEAAKQLGQWPILIIVPAYLEDQWISECHIFFPDLHEDEILLIKGRKPYKPILYEWTTDNPGDPQERLYRIIICNYSVLWFHFERLLNLPISAMICDEAQNLCSSKSQRTKACIALSKRIRFVFLLTATPFENRHKDWIGILKVLHRLKDFGGYRSFTKRFCGAQEVRIKKKAPQPIGQPFHLPSVWDGVFQLPQQSGQTFTDISESTNTAELASRIAPFYLRRTKKQVLPDLPELTRNKVFFSVDDIKQHDSLEAAFAQWLIETNLGDNLAEMYSKEWGPPPLEQPRLVEGIAHYTKLRKFIAETKIHYIAKWAEDFSESGNKLLLFGWHREAIEQLAEQLGCEFIHGGTVNRKQIVHRFMETERFLVAGIRVLGTGYDGLQKFCSNMGIFDLPFTWSAVDQIEGRLHRIGQKLPVFSWRFILQNTTDEETNSMIDAKQTLTDLFNRIIERFHHADQN